MVFAVLLFVVWGYACTSRSSALGSFVSKDSPGYKPYRRRRDCNSSLRFRAKIRCTLGLGFCGRNFEGDIEVVLEGWREGEAEEGERVEMNHLIRFPLSG